MAINEKELDQIIEAHVEYIENTLGHEYYNLGWGIDEIEGTVTSKLYGHPTIFSVISYLDDAGNVCHTHTDHEFSK